MLLLLVLAALGRGAAGHDGAVACVALPVDELACNYTDCRLGGLAQAACASAAPCGGATEFNATFACLACWQLPEEEIRCGENVTCNAYSGAECVGRGGGGEDGGLTLH